METDNHPVVNREEPVAEPVEPEDEMEMDNNPVVPRTEPVADPVEAPVDPEDVMEVMEGQRPVVEPDHEMEEEEIEEARGNDNLVSFELRVYLEIYSFYGYNFSGWWIGIGGGGARSYSCSGTTSCNTTPKLFKKRLACEGRRRIAETKKG